MLLVVLIRLGRRRGRRRDDAGRAFEFEGDESVFAALLGGAGLAFFALIGFEDSVNMAEEARATCATTRVRCSPGC